MDVKLAITSYETTLLVNQRKFPVKENKKGTKISISKKLQRIPGKNIFLSFSYIFCFVGTPSTVVSTKTKAQVFRKLNWKTFAQFRKCVPVENIHRKNATWKKTLHTFQFEHWWKISVTKMPTRAAKKIMLLPSTDMLRIIAWINLFAKSNNAIKNRRQFSVE